MSLQIQLLCICWLIAGLYACNQQVSKQRTDNHGVEALSKAKDRALTKYENFYLVPNADTSYVAVLDQRLEPRKELLKNMHFFVFDAQQKSIILEDHLVLGKVFWTDAQTWTVKKYPGEVDDNIEPDMGYHFDVKTKEKTSI